MHKEETQRNFGAVSISIGILEEVDKLIKELRYWPSRSAFIREACLEKIRHERQVKLKQRETAGRGI